jgi:hypothetical protein
VKGPAVNSSTLSGHQLYLAQSVVCFRMAAIGTFALDAYGGIHGQTWMESGHRSISVLRPAGLGGGLRHKVNGPAPSLNLTRWRRPLDPQPTFESAAQPTSVEATLRVFPDTCPVKFSPD